VSGSTHDHAPDPSSGRARRVVALVAAASIVLAGVLLLVFWPGDAPEVVDYQPFATTLYDAHISAAEEADCPGVPAEDQTEVQAQTTCLALELRLDEGPDAGEHRTLSYVETAGAAHLDVGDDIVVGYSPDAPRDLEYYFADFQRKTPLLLLGLVFVAAVLLLGRFQGVRALIGTAASLLVVGFFLVPALLDGTTPVLAALVASAVIAVLAFYLTHGISNRTNVAYLGTMASLALTAGLAALFVEITHLTGLVDEDVAFLQLSVGRVDVTGLLLAGIVIGALGVLDDVTITQVSAVWELHATDPTASTTRLYRSALTIGRDHMASAVNTLVLAYVGASLPLLLLFTQAKQPLGRILTGEAVATEIVRALVGSVGLIASVPITTALAVAVVGARRHVDEAPEPEPELEPAPEPATIAPRPTWEDFTPEERDF
jgi:uncharacterized membrane protein